ncbi:MAG TPA: hypothetical protein VHC97_17490 [Thermoanaerobaculia bacterium]|jgi:hypothetical protein|nr:hypothetical protein [Thermoanaerobaculia bacterium]
MRGRLVAREHLTEVEREAMLALLATHFRGVTPERFAADLGEKNWVLLLEDEAGLRGFSTLQIYETPDPRGKPITVVYSGDTIVERGAWATAALPKSWIAAVRALRERHPQGPIYWLLLTSGYRTYRFLPVFWREFWPRHGAATPKDVLKLTDLLADQRFGPLYLKEKGIVRFPEPQVLREGLDEIPTGRLADPHVAFFLERNSGWVQGDELVCLTEIAEGNLTPAGRRMWREGRVELSHPRGSD